MTSLRPARALSSVLQPTREELQRIFDSIFNDLDGILSHQIESRQLSEVHPTNTIHFVTHKLLTEAINEIVNTAIPSVVNAALANYTTTAGLNTILANYVTTGALTSALTAYTTTADIATSTTSRMIRSIYPTSPDVSLKEAFKHHYGNLVDEIVLAESLPPVSSNLCQLTGGIDGGVERYLFVTRRGTLHFTFTLKAESVPALGHTNYGGTNLLELYVKPGPPFTNWSDYDECHNQYLAGEARRYGPILLLPSDRDTEDSGNWNGQLMFDVPVTVGDFHHITLFRGSMWNDRDFGLTFHTVTLM